MVIRYFLKLRSYFLKKYELYTWAGIIFIRLHLKISTECTIPLLHLNEPFLSWSVTLKLPRLSNCVNEFMWRQQKAFNALVFDEFVSFNTVCAHSFPNRSVCWELLYNSEMLLTNMLGCENYYKNQTKLFEVHAIPTISLFCNNWLAVVYSVHAFWSRYW